MNGTPLVRQYGIPDRKRGVSYAKENTGQKAPAGVKGGGSLKGRFGIAMADGAIRFAPTDRKQPKLPDGMKKLPHTTDPPTVAPVEAAPMANTDLYGNDRAGKPVLPGPFVDLSGDRVL